MSSRIASVMATFDYTVVIENSHGTLKPAEKGVFLRRTADATAQAHLSTARTELIDVMATDAQAKPWQEKSWKAYRRLQLMAGDIDIDDLRESRIEGLDLSGNQGNLAMDIYPSLVNDNIKIDSDDVMILDVEYEPHRGPDDDSEGHISAQSSDESDHAYIAESEFMDDGNIEEVSKYTYEDFLALVANLREHVGNFQEPRRGRALQMIEEFEDNNLNPR